VGKVLDVSNPSYQGCITPYVVSSEDKTCTTLAANLGLLPTNISSANVGLDCSSLEPGLLVSAQYSQPGCLLSAPALPLLH